MTPYNSHKWHEWICLALDGNEHAYTQLIYEVRPWLQGYFRKRIHAQVIDDLVQDTLLTVHAKRHLFDRRYAFGIWLTTIARNLWIDYLRSHNKQLDPYTLMQLYPQSAEHEHHTHEDLQRLLSGLSPPYAQVIEMVKLKEMSVQEVSEETGHSPSSVKVMVHRGIKKMSHALEKN